MPQQITHAQDPRCAAAGGDRDVEPAGRRHPVHRRHDGAGVPAAVEGGGPRLAAARRATSRARRP